MPEQNANEVTIDSINEAIAEGGAIAGDNRNPRRTPRTPRADNEPEVGVLVQTSPRDAFEALVLHASAKADILAGIRAIESRADLDRVWGISHIQPQAGRCILNFYGDPGTGKTRSARAIAWKLGRPLYQVDYSAVVSKYLGDTAKAIKYAFQRAAHHGAVLFFDEADSLLSKRVDMNESCATSINQNRNVLMQELDRFDGVVIMTTNLFGNYDEAIIRRVAKHIKFDLPDRGMRKRLLEAHLPNRTKVAADLMEVARASKGLSGGDILNVCLNAMYAGSIDEDPANWKITQEIMLCEVEKILAAKQQHNLSKRKAATRSGPIGFHTAGAELEVE